MNRREFLYGTTALTIPVLAGCDNSDEPIVSIDTNYPVSPFGAKSTAEEVTLGLDLEGKTAVVTGCNSGLGYETMRVLAMRGAHVIGTGRNLEKASKACSSVSGKTTPVALELSEFDSIIECSDTVTKLGYPIDILVCNAGINTFGDLELVNGVERIFAVNHLGHFILVNRLMPMLKKANDSRIVHVSSKSAYVQAPKVGIDFDNLRGEGEFDYWEAYGRSKLANALFSIELASRLRGSNVTSNALHPGLVQTNIARNAPVFLRKAFDWFGNLIAKTPEQGAATQVYVATNPSLNQVSGAFFEDCNVVNVIGDHFLFDKPMAEQLWLTSEQMAQGYLIDWE
ncbi:MAG: oxidoreductase [Gammaproteobacteria bacterium]|nr:oxidoreductase [Gammaproteobacteria bacterium]MBI73705.1 oxidoreductase [Gammaproteobacteria bacterium]HAH67116.1 oxidoreductase [Gammaproteobacteria bacterium]|tara:strand:+ start:214 stop:1236 length:1023 start_codon:yes stop_codon:yes gene_type:complete